MASLTRRATQAAGQAISAGISAGIALSDTFSGLTGLGNAADAEQASGASADGGLLSGVLSGAASLFGGSDATDTPGVEAEPTFSGTHHLTEGVEEVEPGPAAAPTPYRRALDAFDAGDHAELSAAFSAMKPGGRERLATNRPEVFQAVVDTGNAEARALQAEQHRTWLDRELRDALLRAESRAIAVAETAWKQYGASRGPRWYQGVREGNKVVVPAAAAVLDIGGIAVHARASATGDIDFVMREDRFGEVEARAQLAFTVALSSTTDGVTAASTMTFTTTGNVGQSPDGAFAVLENPGTWQVG